MRAILPFFASVFAIGTGLSSAATISFQQGVSPSSSYSHLGQDFRGKDNQVNTGNVMSVGYQSGGVLQIRGILGFDLSAIPAGATIDSITLVMTVAETGAGSVTNLGSIELREVIPNGTAANNMVEGQTNWTFWKTDTAWTTPGGDFGNILASAPVDSFTNGQTVIFSSSLLIAAAQASFNAGSPLELILIAPTAEAGSGTHLVRFGSDDNANTSYRPLLTVDYTIPEPSSAGLLSLAVVGIFARRKRRN
jgi:hypothetical protein